MKKLNFPEWQYNEFKQTGVDFDNPNEVDIYDNYMGCIRDIEEENSKIIKDLQVKEHFNIMELGTGTGEFALYASKFCKSIVAYDTSEEMLSHAKEKMQKTNINNVEFKYGSFLTFDDNNQEFDAVITQMALHHLPDTWKMIAIRNIYNVLKPGGKFYLKDIAYSFDVNKYKLFFDNLVEIHETFYGIKAKDYSISFIKDEYPTFSWLLLEMLQHAGFIINTKNNFQDFILTCICTKPL